jgi:hypothetical protein
MKVIPTLALDLRTQERRQTLNISLSDFDAEELALLSGVIGGTEGSMIECGIGNTDDGRICLQLVVGHLGAFDA